MKHISLAVFNYERKKICDIYDSKIHSEGQAYDIVLTKELNGWKELSFDLPYRIDEEKNFRWDYIKSEYLLRLKVGNDIDWFIIHEPKKRRTSKEIAASVQCSHLSSILKTKNLYVSFDDKNGIGTLPYLINKAIAGTGWKIGETDTFLERDGKTEKVRSLISDGKQGTYKLITDICNLFNAYPVFHGDDKSIDFFALNHKLPVKEFRIGKNLNNLSVDYNSENIITRLYVEGEYGDHGYVGIDDVNPTGLSYLLNFKYYESIGLFTSAHQAILDKYLADMKRITAQIKTVSNEIFEKDRQINDLWGRFDYVLYLLSDGSVSRTIRGGDTKDEDLPIKKGDELIVLKSSGPYRTIVVGESVSFAPDDEYAIKYIEKPSAKIGYQEVSIEAKRKIIQSLERELAVTVDEKDKEKIRQQISSIQNEINEIYNGTPEADGLYSNLHAVVLLIRQREMRKIVLKSLQAEQALAEADFTIGMGDMLKDGYWSNTNYIKGQEEYLYQDALDMSEELGKPSVKYTVAVVALPEIMGFRDGEYELNSKIKICDEKLNLKDIVFVTKVTDYLDDPSKSSVEISNEDIALSGKTFESLFSRITNIADLIEQKNSLYDRADAITSDGKIFVDRLEGTIDILKNQLLSSKSGWHTDENGNIMFESVDGGSAMMLSGEGFMIADGKTPEGEWNWRTKHHWFSPQ